MEKNIETMNREELLSYIQKLVSLTKKHTQVKKKCNYSEKLLPSEIIYKIYDKMDNYNLCGAINCDCNRNYSMIDAILEYLDSKYNHNK